MYTITQFKRNGKNRKVDMIFIKVGNYFKTINDVKLKLTDFQKEYLSIIDGMDILDCDKCFLISELLYLVDSCFLTTLHEYEERKKESLKHTDSYRLRVKMYLTKEERKSIHNKLKSWTISEINNDWTTKDNYKYKYHIPSNTLLIQDENDYSAKTYIYVDGTKLLENNI